MCRFAAAAAGTAAFTAGVGCPCAPPTFTTVTFSILSYVECLLKICVSEETIAIGAQEFLALIEGNLALLHALGYPLLQLADELLWIVLYVIQNLLYGFAIEYLVDAVLAILY